MKIPKVRIPRDSYKGSLGIAKNAFLGIATKGFLGIATKIPRGQSGFLGRNSQKILRNPWEIPRNP